MSAFNDLLARPFGYLLSQWLAGGIRARKILIEEYVRPAPGLRVLDVGCGPAYTAAYFPAVEYYGFDVSPEYIAYARSRYGTQGKFYCEILDENTATRLPPVDVVLMLGLLHHITDDEAIKALAVCKSAMGPGARLFTLDGYRAPGQPWVSKAMLDNDRGKFIRDRDRYAELAGKVFADVRPIIRDDLFHIPYPSVILECRT